VVCEVRALQATGWPKIRGWRFLARNQPQREPPALDHSPPGSGGGGGGRASHAPIRTYSKKWDDLKAAYAVQFAYYNLCRVHQTLRVTPAMEAGIANRVWNLGELVA